MALYHIGNEAPFLAYCEKRSIIPITFPLELQHADRKNTGYHFVYEQDLLGWADSFSFKVPSVALFGSGDHHYLTHALLRAHVDKIHEGYSVLLIDNHDDCEDIRASHTTGKYPLNCATHMRESLRKSKMLELIHISSKDAPAADWYDKHLQKRSFEQSTGDTPPLFCTPSFAQSILDSIFEAVYLSIDIDALSHEEVDIEQYQAYDQGKMRLSELCMFVEMALKQKNVLGIDICGMSQDTRAETVYDHVLEVIRRTRPSLLD